MRYTSYQHNARVTYVSLSKEKRVSRFTARWGNLMRKMIFPQAFWSYMVPCELTVLGRGPSYWFGRRVRGLKILTFYYVTLQDTQIFLIKKKNNKEQGGPPVFCQHPQRPSNSVAIIQAIKLGVGGEG